MLTAATAFAAAGCASRGGPQSARVETVFDDVHGMRLRDDYRWMENPSDPDWLPFLREQNAATRAALDALPGRAALAARIAALSGDTAATAWVQAAGTSVFVQQRPAGADNFKLFVRDAGGAMRTLIDPTSMRVGGAHVSLDWWQASFDGRWVAYGLSPAGSEASVLHVIDVASGTVLPERIADTDWGLTGWLPDASGFFYLAFTGRRGTPQFYLDAEVRLHRLRSDPAADTLVLRRGLYADIPMQPVQTPGVRTLAGSDTVLATVRDVRRERALWTAQLPDLLAGRPRWLPVAGFDDLVTSTAVVGDTLYLLSNRSAVRGRVLATPLRRPDLAQAREAMPQRATVIDSLDAARDGVYVRTMDGGVQRLARIGRDGTVADVALPFDGSINALSTSSEHDGAFVSLTGWVQPAGIWQVGADGRVADTGLNPRPPIDTAPYRTRRGFAKAADGTAIPYTLVFRGDLPQGGNGAVLATAYGAYQSSLTPRFAAPLLAFLDAGGVHCTANVRGGGEYGREWHKGGQKETKPNTWRDLIAVCETLVADGVTRPSRLAISGTSAGGIAVGRALTERPDLFAAVVADVGWVNPVRYSAEQNVSDIDEWGPITDAASLRTMLAMDSYQAVRDGTRYPAVLCITGATDPRVAPWHMAKFAARLQAASASGNPVLLRVDFDAGHGLGSTRTQRDALFADIYAFVLWRTGAAGFA